MSQQHDWVRDRLDDYADGVLPEGERDAVGRHLAGCAECAAELEATRRLAARVRALPREIEPARDLWTGIAARIGAPAAAPTATEPGRVIAIELHRARRERGRPGWATRAAAAVALVTLSSAATTYWLRGRAPGPTVAVAPAAHVTSPEPGARPPAPSTSAPEEPAPVQTTASTPAAAPRRSTTPGPRAGGAEGAGALVAFRDTEGTVEALETEFLRRRSTLAPQTVAVVETNLRIIDQAIAEARAALEADPSNAELPLLLSGVYRQKAELLQRATQL